MTTQAEAAIQWPPKHDLFGVRVSAVTCDQACDAILSAAQQREPAVVSAFAVHALIEAATEPALATRVNRFAIITPDGQPVRWALNWLHGVRLKQRVYGPDLMWRLCERAADEGVSIYLYGSSPATLAALEANLLKAFVTIKIAGVESPPFRPLSPEEDAAMIARVNASGAGLLFLGLGCPKQDYFAAEHADHIRAVQLCVGAAFDFHAGTKSTAPEWMQRRGLEWAFRLYQEPRRLWKRYLVTNTIFLQKLAAQWIRHRLLRLPAPRMSLDSP
jgi:exopolysaccharide biosynthesis WecB/TagA/CpsF family protein